MSRHKIETEFVTNVHEGDMQGEVKPIRLILKKGSRAILTARMSDVDGRLVETGGEVERISFIRFMVFEYSLLIFSYALLFIAAVLLKNIWLILSIALIVLGAYYVDRQCLGASHFYRFYRYLVWMLGTEGIFVVVMSLYDPVWIFRDSTIISALFVLNLFGYLTLHILIIRAHYRGIKVIVDKETGEITRYYVWKKREKSA